MSSLTSKNYSKDPRHLVLLKGFSLKERAGTPAQTNIVPIPSLPNIPSIPSVPSVPNVQQSIAPNQPSLNLPSPAQNPNTMIRTNSGSNLAPNTIKDTPHPPPNQAQRWAVPQQQQRPIMPNTDQSMATANSALISQLSTPPNTNQGAVFFALDPISNIPVNNMYISTKCISRSNAESTTGPNTTSNDPTTARANES